MIGALEGTILIKRKDSVVLMVRGVGYNVFVPPRILSHIRIGEEVALFTHTQVREDELSLFGFTTFSELDLFELLLGVSGIGGKTALNIIDRGEEQVRRAVVSADVAFFTSVPRVGKKNAQKVIIELKSKLGSISDLDLSGEEGGETQELYDALTGMGFSRLEVARIVKLIPPEFATVEAKIRQALKMLG